MTRVQTITMFLILSLAVVGNASAQYVEMYRLDNRVKDLPEQDVLNTLATHLGVPADTLKQEKAEYKSSVGELYAAHQFAKQARSDFKTMMAQLKSGKSWGEVARDNNVDMDQFSKDAHRLEDALKKNQRASK